MENKILTVVIPAYNVERYLWDTVPTMCDVRIMDDIEILIVSDGSNDNTVSIAKEIIKKYGDSIKIIEKENGGHGSTINLGIRLAKGVYFKVIDGDDWVDTDQFVKFVQELKTQNSDLVVNGYKRISDRTKKEIESIDYNTSISGSVVMFDSCCNKNPYVGIHAFTIKTSILRDKGVSIRERVFYEDTEFILFPIPYIRTVYYSTANVYRYRVDSITQSVNIGNLKKNRVHREKVISDLLSYYESNINNMSEEKKVYYAKRVKEAVLAQYKVFSAFEKYDCALVSEIADFSAMIRDSRLGKEFVKHNVMLRVYSVNNRLFIKLLFKLIHTVRVMKHTWN